MPIPIETYYRIKDAVGRLSTITIPVASATAVADLAGYVDDMANLIAACINGSVEQAGYSIPVLAGAIGTPDATSDVQESAMLSFRSIEGYLKKLSLPTFDEAKMVAGSVLVNVADTAVAALITAIVDGLTQNAHVVSAVTSHNEDLSVLDAAVELWGRARG